MQKWVEPYDLWTLHFFACHCSSINTELCSMVSFFCSSEIVKILFQMWYRGRRTALAVILLALCASDMTVCKSQGAARPRDLLGQVGGKSLPQSIRWDLHGDGPRSGWDVSPQAGQGWRRAHPTGAGTDGPGLGRNGVVGHGEGILKYSFKHSALLLLYQNPHQIN